MKKILVILFIINISFAAGGSLYSKYGIGNPVYSYSARSFSMGQTGIALINQDYVSYFNPASWNAIKLTRFEAGLSYTGYDISSSQNSAFYSKTEFSGFTLSFPVSTDIGIGVVAGLMPYSSVQYEVADKSYFPNIGDYSVTYKGSGGMSKLFIGIGYKLPFGMSLGATYEYLNGNIEKTTDANFDNIAGINNSKYLLNLKSNGPSYKFGLISPDLADLLGTGVFDDIRVGFTYDLMPEIKTDSVLTTESSSGTNVVYNHGYMMKIPSRFGAGLSFAWNQKYTVVFDYLYQPFSDYAEGNNKSVYLRDSQRISAGFEYRHESGRFGTTWEQIKWRCGLSYEQTPVELNGKAIDELGAYAGFSYPIGFNSSLDLGIGYGFRGTTENNLMSENLFKFNVSFSFGELWFIRNER